MHELFHEKKNQGQINPRSFENLLLHSRANLYEYAKNNNEAPNTNIVVETMLIRQIKLLNRFDLSIMFLSCSTRLLVKYTYFCVFSYRYFHNSIS